MESEPNSAPARLAKAKDIVSYFTTAYSALVGIVGVSGFIGLSGLLSSLEKSYLTLEDVATLKGYLKISLLATTIFFIASGYLILSTMYLRRTLRSYLQVWPSFLTMAHENALCDKALFLSLFIELKNSIALERKLNGVLKRFILSNVTKAEGQCRGNINSIVAQAVAIFNASTNDTCAVSVKAVSKDGFVRTIRRDALSTILRRENEEQDYKIEDNTAYIETISYGKQHYECVNLVAASRAKTYVNARKEWWKDYNATLVYRISSAEEPEFNWLFCVDNFKGGFNRAEVIRSAAEICERLGVMIHRLLSLEKIRVTQQQGEPQQRIERGQFQHE